MEVVDGLAYSGLYGQVLAIERCFSIMEVVNGLAYSGVFRQVCSHCMHVVCVRGINFVHIWCLTLHLWGFVARFISCDIGYFKDIDSALHPLNTHC